MSVYTSSSPVIIISWTISVITVIRVIETGFPNRGNLGYLPATFVGLSKTTKHSTPFVQKRNGDKQIKYEDTSRDGARYIGNKNALSVFFLEKNFDISIVFSNLFIIIKNFAK